MFDSLAKYILTYHNVHAQSQMDQRGKHTFGFGHHPPKLKAFRKLKHLSKRMGKRKVKDKVGKAVALWMPFKELHTDWSEVVRSRTAQGQLRAELRK